MERGENPRSLAICKISRPLSPKSSSRRSIHLLSSSLVLRRPATSPSPTSLFLFCDVQTWVFCPLEPFLFSILCSSSLKPTLPRNVLSKLPCSDRINRKKKDLVLGFSRCRSIDPLDVDSSIVAPKDH
ncbi:hypothetical protein CKAN_00085900 [Cinnamomum micranthum f. kanehirae]|uniref:Uncharacterized protein n=1 Tax=Cinnamomum micranthum f. kanehirae TaxID=337451 RepID=A0A443N277_9MAGN|nr:hypothetical protein CKAN_00085900 [Cinnamomum micranthum f. kanehirae]